MYAEASHPATTKCLSPFTVVIQCHTYSAPVMPIVLSYNTLTSQFPQSRKVITACRDKICRISAKRTIPHPSLVILQRSFKIPPLALASTVSPITHRTAQRRTISTERMRANCPTHGRRPLSPSRHFKPVPLRPLVDGPDLRRVVGAAGGQVLNVWTQQHARNVTLVCGECATGFHFCALAHDFQFPDEDAAGVVAGAEECAVAGDCHGGHAHVFFWDEL